MWLYLCMQLFLSCFWFPLCIPPSVNWPFFSERLSPCSSGCTRLHFSGLGLQAYAIISSPFFTSLPYTHTHTYVFLRRFTYCFMCMSVVDVYACVPHVYLVPEAIGVRSHGTGVTDNCELPCGFWGPNLGPGSSAREAGTLNHWLIFPALPSYIVVAKSLIDWIFIKWY